MSDIVECLCCACSPPNLELLKFLEGCLNNRNTTVAYEAAKSICAMPGLSSQQVLPAIVNLQELLGSQVPAHKFAAVRTLSQVVLQHPLVSSGRRFQRNAHSPFAARLRV